MTHSFSSKVDLHQRIHQVLPVAVDPENLPHPVHEGIVHCRQETFLNFYVLVRE